MVELLRKMSSRFTTGNFVSATLVKHSGTAYQKQPIQIIMTYTKMKV